MQKVSDSKREGVTGAFALSYVPMVCHRDCPDRSWDCHGRCKDYMEYREACDRELHKKNLQRDVVDTVCDRIANREKLHRK